MRKQCTFWILLFAILLCACSPKDQAVPVTAPTEPPMEEIAPTAEPTAGDTQGELMFNSMIYATLDTEGKKIWTGSEAGIKEFRVPENWTGAKGGIRAWYGYELDAGTGLTKTDIVYIPSSEEAYDALRNDLSELLAQGMSDEESIKKIDNAFVDFQNSIAVLFSVIGVPNNGDPESAKRLMLNSLMNAWLLSEEEAKAQLDEYTFIPAGTVEDYNFYLITSPRNVRNAFDGEKASWKEEYDALQKDVPGYVENFTFERPAKLSELTGSGTKISFETKDLNGNAVSSSDLFAGHKATMINIWETTCVGCISEMPQLNAMAKEFEEKGGQIIGIVYDAEEDELIEEAKEILSDLQVGYTNLLPTAEIKKALFVQSFPTTYFVNENGELVSAAIVGTQLRSYRLRMEELLGQ